MARARFRRNVAKSVLSKVVTDAKLTSPSSIDLLIAGCCFFALDCIALLILFPLCIAPLFVLVGRKKEILNFVGGRKREVATKEMIPVREIPNSAIEWFHYPEPQVRTLNFSSHQHFPI
jgi:hypothetical protein